MNDQEFLRYYDNILFAGPDDPPVYSGECRNCYKFEECPCGCGWGYCEVVGEMFDGSSCADECSAAETDSDTWGWK